MKRKEYGQNVARLRRALGKTQEELAEAANRSPHCIQLVEGGESNATIDTLGYIADVLQTDWRILWILCWDEKEISDAANRMSQMWGKEGKIRGYGESIVLIRKARGVTQKELAHKAGISQGWLREIEHDCANMTVERLECAAIGLGVSLLELSIMCIPGEELWEMINRTRSAIGRERGVEELQYITV